MPPCGVQTQQAGVSVAALVLVAVDHRALQQATGMQPRRGVPTRGFLVPFALRSPPASNTTESLEFIQGE